jgi:hypothetical protein
MASAHAIASFNLQDCSSHTSQPPILFILTPPPPGSAMAYSCHRSASSVGWDRDASIPTVPVARCDGKYMILLSSFKDKAEYACYCGIALGQMRWTDREKSKVRIRELSSVDKK